MLEVMMPELIAATKDFYHMTGIKIVLFDEARRLLYSYPEGMCRFCHTVRTSRTLAEKCFHCDRLGFDHCDRTRKPYIYQCHMGLSEAIVPIVENRAIIGYMMMGQILCEGDEQKVREAIDIVAGEVSRTELEEGLAAVKRVNTTFVHSALHVMSMCVCYLYYHQIIRSRREELCERLREYVAAHFAEPLTVASLCQRLYLSKSKLYQLSLQAFGRGVSEEISARRMEKARELLCRGEESVAEIAGAVGFADANYFVRAFKTTVGVTPLAYRRAHRQKT